MAVPDPTSFLYRVDGGAWDAIVGTDGFTDTSTPSYAGSGDDEYALYDGTDDFTEVDTPPDMTGFGFANDWTFAARFQLPSGAPDEEQYIFGMGLAAGGASKVYFSVNTSGSVVVRVDAGSENRQFTGTTATVNDATDHIICVRHDNTLNSLTLRVDDAADGSSSTTGLTDNTTELEHMVIGAEPIGTIGESGYWSGRVYWVAGWDDTLLSTTESDELNDSSWPFSIPSLSNTLTADSGSFTLTGTAASIEHNAYMSGGSGEFVTTGTAAGLLHGAHIDADTTSFAYTGTDASLVGPTRLLDAESGSFVKSGTNVDFVKASTLVGESGTFVYTGTDADIFTDVQLLAESGTFTITGADAGLYFGAYFLAEMGVVQMSADDVTFTSGIRLDAESGAFTYTGTDLDFTRSYSPLVGDSASFALTGADVDLFWQHVLDGSSGSYILTGADAALSATGAAALVAESTAFAYTGTSVAFLVGRHIDTDSGVYLFTGTDAVLSSGVGGLLPSGPYTRSRSRTQSTERDQYKVNP